MWELITSVPKKEQDIIVLLDALEGTAKAEKAVADIKANELNDKNGLKVITVKLDKIFLEETLLTKHTKYILILLIIVKQLK